MHVTAIIAAGGAGSRVGASAPKQFLRLADGRTILERSVGAFSSHDRVADIVVALPSGAEEALGDGPSPKVRTVAGGARRQDSVANAFDAVRPASDIVLVHDAARPFVSHETISRAIDAAAAYGAAIVAVPVTDTVKQVTLEAGERVVAATIPRESIYLAQTPQAFKREVLAAAVALGRSGVEGTDEAALAERAGYRVHVVEGESANVKITTEDDLRDARQRMSGRARTGRAGTGYDNHRLVEGRPLIVAGVTVPSERGALGHSDADVVCHAATDAVLGAAGLGDIGRHFPDTDPRWKDASSLVLLEQAAAMVREAGYELGNLDVTVILERPKIKDYVDEMRERLAHALGTDASRVSVKGKTNEGMDAVGRGEAIAAHAVALIRSRS